MELELKKKMKKKLVEMQGIEEPDREVARANETKDFKLSYKSCIRLVYK